MTDLDRHDDRAVAADFELPNVGVGPDPLSLDDVAANADFAVLLLLRDYHCPKCKKQVRSWADVAKRFAEHNAAILPVLPEPVGRARKWQSQFSLPFPLLADPDKEIGGKYDQPTQLGPIGRIHDLIGRLPETVVLDCRGDTPEIVATYEGENPADRPEATTVVEEIADLQQAFVFDCSLVDC